MTKPTTRPIILRPEEVRAALDDRLSMLWRPVWPQPPPETQELGMSDCGGYWRDFPSETRDWRCPFGSVGTVLWGRETWQQTRPRKSDRERFILRHPQEGCGDLHYAADGDNDPPPRWRPSSIMPYWACRPELRNLKVTKIEVRPVQSITIDEIAATGIQHGFGGFDADEQQFWERFSELWDRHAKRPGHKWAENPWAWAATIRKVKL